MRSAGLTGSLGSLRFMGGPTVFCMFPRSSIEGRLVRDALDSMDDSLDLIFSGSPGAASVGSAVVVGDLSSLTALAGGGVEPAALVPVLPAADATGLAAALLEDPGVVWALAPPLDLMKVRAALRHAVRWVRLTGEARTMSERLGRRLQSGKEPSPTERMFEGLAGAAVAEIESRDPATAGHSARVAFLSVELAEAIGAARRGPFADVRISREEIRELHYAALLHDVGKIALPGSLLAKCERPRADLPDVERLEIEAHVERTRRFLARIPWVAGLSGVPAIAYAHHERLDGSGYPRGLKGLEIPLLSRAMTICDIFDAATSRDRPDRRAVSAERALAILRDEVKDGKLDGDILQVFVEARVFERLAARARQPGAGSMS